MHAVPRRCNNAATELQRPDFFLLLVLCWQLPVYSFPFQSFNLIFSVFVWRVEGGELWVLVVLLQHFAAFCSPCPSHFISPPHSFLTGQDTTHERYDRQKRPSQTEPNQKSYRITKGMRQKLRAVGLSSGRSGSDLVGTGAARRVRRFN